MTTAHPFRTGALGERVRHLAEYLPLRAVAGAFQCVSERQNLRTADLIGNIYARMNKRRVERARSNIRRAFPEMPEQEVRQLAIDSICYMFRLFMVDGLSTPRMITRWNWQEHVELDEFGEALHRLSEDSSVLMVTAHCGNWELLGFVMGVLGFPITALARPLDNPHLDRWLLGVRQAAGMRILTKWGATEQIEGMIEGDDPVGRRIGFTADQNAGDNGLYVPFLGRLASSYKSIGLLAMKYNIPVIAGYAPRTEDGFKFRVKVVDTFGPDDWSSQPDPLFYITARFNHAIEKMVRESPDQFLWIHRRWKSRPRWERAGKPMPASMHKRLESLPWMTQDELDRIVEDTNNPGAM